jgi:flagellar motor switch protein FliM
MPAVTPKATDKSTDQVAESAARAMTRRAITNSVQEVFIDVAARLASTRMTSGAIMGLSVGDVVRFPHPVTKPLDLVAGESVCGSATLGQQGARVACLVVSSRKSIA